MIKRIPKGKAILVVSLAAVLSFSVATLLYQQQTKLQAASLLSQATLTEEDFDQSVIHSAPLEPNTAPLPDTTNVTALEAQTTTQVSTKPFYADFRYLFLILDATLITVLIALLTIRLINKSVQPVNEPPTTQPPGSTPVTVDQLNLDIPL